MNVDVDVITGDSLSDSEGEDTSRGKTVSIRPQQTLLYCIALIPPSAWSVVD